MKNRTKRTAKTQKVIEAIAANFKSAATITLGGKDYTAKELQLELQTDVDAAKATESARTTYQLAVAAEQKTASQINALTKALRSHLIGAYGAESAIVAGFGFTPKKAKVDVATKAHAIEQNLATRAARGTKGPKERLKVVGTVPATINAPAPVPAPASNGAASKTAAS